MSSNPIVLQPGTYSVPPLPAPVIINNTFIPAVQNSPFELLWGVGRSKPVTNPPIHGTATWTQDSPSLLTYAPAKLPTGDRDNLYCLRRMGGLGLPDFSKATYFSESQVFTVSDVTAPEAIECDWHMQPVGTKIINPGLQLLAGKPWSVRLWDEIKGSWQDAGVTFDGAMLANGCLIAAEYSVNPGVSFTYTSVSINGLKFPLKTPYTQALATGTAVTSAVFNKAVQTDANGVASPYNLKIDQLTLNYR